MAGLADTDEDAVQGGEGLQGSRPRKPEDGPAAIRLRHDLCPEVHPRTTSSIQHAHTRLLHRMIAASVALGCDSEQHRRKRKPVSSWVAAAFEHQVGQEVVAGQHIQREITDPWGIDRSTFTHTIKLAKQAAMERLATSKPGRPGKSAAEHALEDAKAEIERLKAKVTE